jgi:hypothetical protein
VHRVLREFDDHADDIAGEGDAPRARLGEPAQLAQRFAAEYRARHFAGRHPWFVFLVAPIPCTILAAILSYIAGFGLLELLGAASPLGAMRWSSQFLAIIVCNAGLILPLLSVTWIFGRWAFRSGCGARWLWTVTALQCSLGAITQLNMALPTEPGNGTFSVGFSFPPQVHWPFVLLPLLVAVGLARHARQAEATPRHTSLA